MDWFLKHAPVSLCFRCLPGPGHAVGPPCGLCEKIAAFILFHRSRYFIEGGIEGTEAGVQAVDGEVAAEHGPFRSEGVDAFQDQGTD